MADFGSEPNHTMGIVDKEKSWYLLAILLNIGRPLCPEELASQCKLFTASPDVIRFVSSASDSPLHLMENGLVTVSVAAIFTVGKFVSIAMNRGFASRYGFWASEPKRSRYTDLKTYFRKRKGTMLDKNESSTPKRRLLLPFAEGEREQNRLPIFDGIEDISLAEYVETFNVTTRRTLFSVKFESEHMHSGRVMIPLHLDITGKSCGCSKSKVESRETDNNARTDMFLQGEISGTVYKSSDSFFKSGRDLNCQKPVELDRFMKCKIDVKSALPASFQDPLLCEEALVGDIRFGNKVDYSSSNIFCHEDHEQNIIHSVYDSSKSHICKASMKESNEVEGMQVENGSKEGFIGYEAESEKVNVALMVKPAPCGELRNGLGLKNEMHKLNLDKDETVRKIESQATFQIAQSSSNVEQLLNFSNKLKGEQKNDPHQKPQILMESLAYNKFHNASKNVDQCKNGQEFIASHKLLQRRNSNVHAKENIVDTTSMTPKVEKKIYPSFDTFTIEEEEGSGGYGTVYRARRKNDGKRLAIKCPHGNAHKNHINNERIMLERFGGRNFIIKFEGSFKSDSGDCFVLEHAEHDRPEVLKKEIDIFQLQWYGYCLFRALAFLHKEGVVHRDVKPGNFLFSRKLNKGYLIDFNLAMDLKQKYSIGSKSKSRPNLSNNIPLPSASAPSIKEFFFEGSKSLASNQRASAGSKLNSEPNRHVKQKAYDGSLKNCPDKAGGNLHRAQGTNGLGITSAKDITSTKTPSTERLREPLPSLGRKELISLVHNSVQCADHCLIKGPASQRKRVAATSGMVDGKITYFTPMPLHSSTIAAGLLRSKGNGKHKKEDSCVGTKGFRAPEVLFRSMFQGPKVDIWSAGVTFLYLMIGRTPFTGDPELNIKDIAKLRGREDLWEVAKLHDRELSLPVELYDERYLQSLDLESWCRIHTKRLDFLKHIPKSLFDLVNKCLTVNPRNRISAEEALKHEFFASCHEKLRKQRMIQQGLCLNSAGIQGNHVDEYAK